MGVASQWVHGAKVCVIPRPENNYQPLALRRRSLALLGALLLISKLAALGVLGLTPQTAELSVITTNRILQLTNQERASRGLPELAVNTQLAGAAQRKAKDMLDDDYFAHISPDGVTPWFWMAQAGYRYRVAGENLAIDFSEAEDVVQAWMNSPSHRDNLLEAGYTETGIAVLTGEFEGGTSTIVVHMFGTPSVAAATTPAAQETAPAPPADAGPPAEALPTPAPVPVPRVPRIALEGQTGVVTATALLIIEAEAGTTVYVRAGEEVIASAGVPETGTVRIEAPLDSVPDGSVLFSAYARDAVGQTSAASDVLRLTKDTAGPALARGDLAFILSSATDRPQFALIPPALAYDTLAITAGETNLTYRPEAAARLLAFALPLEPVTIAAADEHGNTNAVEDLVLVPSFLTERQTDFVRPPALLGQLSRRLALAGGAAVGVLLLGAILIRIRIQHPRMILHGSLVLLLAGALFMW